MNRARILSLLFLGGLLLTFSARVLAELPAAASLTGANPPSGCRDGMVEIAGEYCPVLEQKCLRFIDPEKAFPRRCAEFAPSSGCSVPAVKKHFCIDRYEYPNEVGEARRHEDLVRSTRRLPGERQAPLRRQ